MPLLYPPLFTPSLHREIHQADGADEINVKGLSILTSGLEADKPTPAKPGRIYWAFDSGILYRDNGNQWIKIAVKDFPDLDESSHKTTHQDGGSDELLVTGLSGLLADAQTPLAHKTTHQDGGSDELLVTGLSGLLADAQTPLAHKTTHQDGGSDEINLENLSGIPIDVNNRVMVRAYRSGDQLDIPNITFIKVQLNAETFDPGGWFDSSINYRFTAPVTGYYLIIGSITYKSLIADKLYSASLWVNSGRLSDTRIHAAMSAGWLTVTVNDIRYLIAGDYVELFAYHEAGVDTVDIYGLTYHTFMSIHLLSRA